MHILRTLSALAAATSIASATPSPLNSPKSPPPVSQTVCNGRTYTNDGLAGYGFVPSDGRDKFGDNIGGLGSSISLESWKRVVAKDGSNYEGILWTLPDRGWNTEGVLNHQPRVHKFRIRFAPRGGTGTVDTQNLQFEYLDTVLFYGPDGEPVSGLDPDPVGGTFKFPGFPELPGATYAGDGFGGDGPGGRRITVDSEGLALAKGGGFWVSDEYGPYVYRFDESGKMVEAIRPPGAFIPQRNGSDSFSANSPPRYDPTRTVTPKDPSSGRGNNQGFEGLTLSPDGSVLTILIQSALTQEGGLKSTDRRHARMLQYDVSKRPARYLNEFVVPLPLFETTNDKNEKETRVAGQSEILQVSDDQFLVLARDSGAGAGQNKTRSVYRQTDVFDISRATNIKGKKFDDKAGAIASKKGKLEDGIKTAEYCPWLDFNNDEQLAKFGLRNGGVQGPGLLNEKWEGLALGPVDGKEGKDGEFYMIAASDNDFITQNGFFDFGSSTYRDKSGFNLDNQALVFKVKIPKKEARDRYYH